MADYMAAVRMSSVMTNLVLSSPTGYLGWELRLNCFSSGELSYFLSVSNGLYVQYFNCDTNYDTRRITAETNAINLPSVFVYVCLCVSWHVVWNVYQLMLIVFYFIFFCSLSVFVCQNSYRLIDLLFVEIKSKDIDGYRT